MRTYFIQLKPIFVFTEVGRIVRKYLGELNILFGGVRYTSFYDLGE